MLATPRPAPRRVVRASEPLPTSAATGLGVVRVWVMTVRRSGVVGARAAQNHGPADLGRGHEPSSRTGREILPVRQEAQRTSTPRQNATRPVISLAASFGSG